MLLPVNRGTLSATAIFSVCICHSVATAQAPDVASPPVSYLFFDSLAETPEHSNIASPLVSYFFYDWLADENTIFEYSPLVSYYSGGGASLVLTGIVKDQSGAPVSGAEVIIKRHHTVFWQGMTDADGSLPVATIPAGNFNVIIKKAGYTSLFQSIPGDAGGPILINFTLRPALELPNLVTVNRTPEETAIRQLDEEPIPGVRASNLRVFSEGVFSTTAPLLSDRMTIVICHGWLSNLDGWATLMASYISANHSLGANPPNIVGWDWREQAKGIRPPVDQAAIQGEHLGKALYLELGSNFDRRIHFIGHSLGAIVNATACDYLHGANPRMASRPPNPWQPTSTRPHATLLDHAETANMFGSFVSTTTIGAWLNAQSRSELLDIISGVSSHNSNIGYKSPYPKSSAWSDSYNSLVGIYHHDVVNVYLPFGSHGRAHEWYRQSIQHANSAHVLGFNRAYEKTLVLPTLGDGFAPGAAWISNSSTSDIFDFVLAEESSVFSDKGVALRASTVVAGSIVGTVDSLGNSVLSNYEMGLEWVGELEGRALMKTGQVAASVNEKIGNLWDAALDKAFAINPDRLFTGSIGLPALKLTFTTPPGSFRSTRNVGAPPQAWLTVQVPENTGFMVFDFTVTGEPGQDVIACALNEQNLFTLPARFAPDDSPVSTDFLDVSAFAGQEVELYFGLVGGTSIGCALAIDGVRFVTIPTPILAASVVGDQVRLEWPAAAVGWIPQHSPGLSPENWQDVPLPESMTAFDGVFTFERPRLPAKEFFRLKRVE